ncbi:hypothetical protein M404DRAFT_746349 [Pisolithus tinctorius Marx 270]|uniref:Uncharacterized protein n=1 Tax=Pisolithus tinctorius Marx 270 TaxID=870435 RepID=A0A0C3KR36_PISTI|nr:hypothetical protein M404DRAFT_746349 [Pisolithus tinctorius Marx 270]
MSFSMLYSTIRSTYAKRLFPQTAGPERRLTMLQAVRWSSQEFLIRDELLHAIFNNTYTYAKRLFSQTAGVAIVFCGPLPLHLTSHEEIRA